MIKITTLSIALIISIGFLSGCIQTTDINGDDESSEIDETTSFLLYGNITNNYAEDVEVDFIVSAEYYTDWYYSTVDEGTTIYPSAFEVKEYSCEVKAGYEKYFFLISWYYIGGELDGEQGGFAQVNFTNSVYEDVIYHVEIKRNKEIEISSTFHPPEPYEPLIVSISAITTSGIPPLTVLFTSNVEGSQGNITSYSWDFGDGNKATQQNPTHDFVSVGTYNVKLTVIDDYGATGTNSITIEVIPVEIIDYQDFAESYDWVRIVGLVKNFGNDNIEEVKVKATLYNSENSIIGFGDEYTHTADEYSGILMSQETTGFMFRFSNMPDYDHCTLEIESYSTTSQNAYHDNLEIIDIHEDPRDGYSYLSGIVRNLGNQDVSSVFVYANLLDGGKIAYIEKAPLGTVYSGQSESFNVWIWDSYAYDNYELEVTCWE